MELTKQIFEDFKNRLHYWNKGEGAKDHITANPIFIVQKLERIYGFDPDYCDSFVFVNEDSEWESVTDLFDCLDEDEIKRIVKDADCDTLGDFLLMDKYNQVQVLNEFDYRKVYYKEHWSHVSSHFTREAAAAFIKRKKHDYRQLRIYVEAQPYCWEYNMIIQAILDGKIDFIDGEV